MKAKFQVGSIYVQSPKLIGCPLRGSIAQPSSDGFRAKHTTILQECPDRLPSTVHLSLETHQIEDSTLFGIESEYQLSPSPYHSLGLAIVPMKTTCVSYQKHF